MVKLYGVEFGPGPGPNCNFPEECQGQQVCLNAYDAQYGFIPPTPCGHPQDAAMREQLKPPSQENTGEATDTPTP